MPSSHFDVLAICGSLRAASINRILLQAAQKIAPEAGLAITLLEGLGTLPGLVAGDAVTTIALI